MSSMSLSMFFEHSFPLIIMPNTLDDFSSSSSITNGSIDMHIYSSCNNPFYPVSNQPFTITFMANSFTFSTFHHNVNYYPMTYKFYPLKKKIDQFLTSQTLHKYIVEGKNND